MKIYFVDLGWQGALFIISDSLESAFQFQKTINDFEEFQKLVEIYEISTGLCLENLGDR